MSKHQRDYSNQIPLAPAQTVSVREVSAWVPDSEVDLLHLITKGPAEAVADARAQRFLATWEAPRITMLLWGHGDRVWSASNELLSKLLETGLIYYHPVGMAVYPIERPGQGAVVLASKLSTFSREPALALANMARKRGTNAKRE